MAEYVPICTAEDARQSVEQAKSMLKLARLMWSRASEAVREAQIMREDLHAQIAKLARTRPACTKFVSALLAGILDAAIASTGADMGNMQLFDPKANRLVIYLQRGFKTPFLEYFNSVESGEAACGAALKSRQRVIVSDVASSPVFLNKECLEVMLDAGVRSLQSTPLINKAGRFLGMLSTHHRGLNYPGKRDLRLIDHFADWATEILEVGHCASLQGLGTIIAIDGSRKRVPSAPAASDD